MKISQSMLDKAIEAKILSQEQAKRLWDFIKESPEQGQAFDLTNLLYYFGGLLAIGAMTLFMNLGWELFGGWGIFFISLCYGILGLSFTSYFDQKKLLVPAGICATFAVFMTPLAVYGLQKALGYWDESIHYQQYNYFIRWQWIMMEFATLIAGSILIYIYRYPFMMLPMALTLWYMSMDLTSLLNQGRYSFELGAMVSMDFGLVMMAIAFWIDIRSPKARDYSFWLYLFGVTAFWTGLSCQHSDSELSKFFYLCINLGLLFIGVALERRVFVVFGALGVCGYLGHLAYTVFKDSYLFPFILTFLGFGIIYLGVLWQRRADKVRIKLQSFLPEALKKLI